MKTNKAYFAAGCFWGVEYYFQKQSGVVETTVGYMGGSFQNPTYEDVCNVETGHAEVVEVQFDEKKITYEQLCKLFFEIHDFEDQGGQGPDRGQQYRSEIFVVDDNQEKIASSIVEKLSVEGYKVATKISRAGRFWQAEDYHQDYYDKNGSTPYCHFRRAIFV
jgi:methionine-S-sulfoxide reductase